MDKFSFTVVIATYNRAELVGRAIQSVFDQNWSDTEIIVVDDASTDHTARVLQTTYSQVRYLRQELNQGPGPARERGIKEARNPWVVILDDDDELDSHALYTFSKCLDSFTDRTQYPVFQFAHSNGRIPDSFRIIRLNDYLSGALVGDFIPVIQKTRFLELGFAYPNLRIGGEHLLWWKIAQQFGIPTWNIAVARVHSDASVRLTSADNQIRRAEEYARLQEITLEQFGDVFMKKYPNYYRTKQLGAAAYWLLAGNRYRARLHLRAIKPALSLSVLVLWIMSFMPRIVVQWFLRIYRQRSTL